jgi:hypothetical protein
MFKLIASGQSVASRNPFTVNAVTGEISFNGVVDFTNTNASGTTTIDGSKITSGSIKALQIAANTITTNNLTTGITLVNGQVSSSDFTTIGGTGFRLKSNASGTSADPTIYGAYIKGGVLEASTFLYKTTSGLPTKQFITSAYSTYNFIGSSHGYYTGSYTFNLGIYAYNAVSCPTGQRLSQESGNVIEFLARIEAPITDADGGDIESFSLLLGDVVLATYNGQNGYVNFYPNTFNLYGLDITVDSLAGTTYSGSDIGPTYNGHFYILIRNSSLQTLSGEGELKLKFTHSYSSDYLTIQPKFTINNF